MGHTALLPVNTIPLRCGYGLTMGPTVLRRVVVKNPCIRGLHCTHYVPKTTSVTIYFCHPCHLNAACHVHCLCCAACCPHCLSCRCCPHCVLCCSSPIAMCCNHPSPVPCRTACHPGCVPCRSSPVLSHATPLSHVSCGPSPVPCITPAINECASVLGGWVCKGA